MNDLVLQSITKSYDGKEVLRNVSAVFPAAKTGCIFAPSGAGKTTLLRMLLGLEKPDEGSISGLEGAVVSAVFQEDRLCESLSVSKNIRVACPGVGISEIREHLSYVGLSGIEKQKACELSGG